MFPVILLDLRKNKHFTLWQVPEMPIRAPLLSSPRDIKFAVIWKAVARSSLIYLVGSHYQYFTEVIVFRAFFSVLFCKQFEQTKRKNCQFWKCVFSAC